MLTVIKGVIFPSRFSFDIPRLTSLTLFLSLLGSQRASGFLPLRVLQPPWTKHSPEDALLMVFLRGNEFKEREKKEKEKGECHRRPRACKTLQECRQPPFQPAPAAITDLGGKKSQDVEASVRASFITNGTCPGVPLRRCINQMKSAITVNRGFVLWSVNAPGERRVNKENCEMQNYAEAPPDPRSRHLRTEEKGTLSPHCLLFDSPN